MNNIHKETESEIKTLQIHSVCVNYNEAVLIAFNRLATIDFINGHEYLTAASDNFLSVSNVIFYDKNSLKTYNRLTSTQLSKTGFLTFKNLTNLRGFAINKIKITADNIVNKPFVLRILDVDEQTMNYKETQIPSSDFVSPLNYQNNIIELNRKIRLTEKNIVTILWDSNNSDNVNINMTINKIK